MWPRTSHFASNFLRAAPPPTIHLHWKLDSRDPSGLHILSKLQSSPDRMVIAIDQRTPKRYGEMDSWNKFLSLWGHLLHQITQTTVSSLNQWMHPIPSLHGTHMQALLGMGNETDRCSKE
eukprot:TRINITY_DN10828_c0_g1_i2.p1 TRINITY_DN10828_c0_g1~~TRINITY_DN10828_c0_g1_i2.p1  ORF type:complete len:120 (+),score=20.28 TRINITY_DN10828_c0_g1_i2:236-595(+)